MIEDCYMTGIIDKINSLYPISDDTIRTLKESMTLCRFPKKYQLIRAGMYCKSAYFIGKGMTRSFWLVNGEEIRNCDWSSDVCSSDLVAYKIALSDLIRLFQTNIELANWGRIIHQDEYRRLHRSHKERLTLSAKERYEEFRQQFPQVNQRAQLGYIASYLGITLSTLSRLRGARK